MIILAHENARAGGKEPQWIGALYEEAFAKSDKATRKDAQALLPALSSVKATSVLPSEAKPSEIFVMPAQEKAQAPGMPASDRSGPGAPQPAPIGMSVGFGGNRGEAGFKP